MRLCCIKRRTQTPALAGLLVLAAALFLAGACQADEGLAVAVSILPQKYFVERIGGRLVETAVMVRPGASPATYEPRPRQMMALAESKIYFAIGVPFEQVWLPKIASANQGMRIVHTEAGIERFPMAAPGHGDRRPTPGRTAMDPHVWLSPPLALIQARHILSALCQAEPASAETFQANYKELAAQIVALDLELMALFGGAEGGRRFMVFHPAWGYFARAYGLDQVPIEAEGKDPKPAALKELIEKARRDGIKVIFAQPQFSMRSAETIAQAIGGRVVTADPLAEDWLANLKQVAATFRSALR